MKVSIIIPCYNQAQYLGEAIESALDQTYENIEIIVVNDGSPDKTKEVASLFPVKLVNQANKGLASARNTGIMNAMGDYVLPLDSDDFLVPYAVETLVELAKQTDADVVGASIHCFGLGEANTILMPNPTFDDFKEGNRLAYCALIKKSVLLETGGYSPRMDTLGGWEDLHLWYDLMRRGKKIVTSQIPLMWYRTKETSMWTKTKGKEKQLWEQIVKDFPETKEHVKS